MSRKSYNGFSPTERGRVSRWSKRVGVPQGLVPPVDDHCYACGVGEDETPLAAHNEDYSRPHTRWTLCKFCHMLIHSRFTRPDEFVAYRDRLAEGYRMPGNRLHFGTWQALMNNRFDSDALVRGMTVPTDVDSVLAGLSLTPIDLNVPGVREEFGPLIGDDVPETAPLF